MKKLVFAALLAAASLAHAAGEAITVYKDAHCGCCEGWVAYLRDAGYQVKTINTDDMPAVKKRLGVPDTMASCHTGVVEASGQVIEGHVPVCRGQEVDCDAERQGRCGTRYAHELAGHGQDGRKPHDRRFCREGFFQGLTRPPS